MPAREYLVCVETRTCGFCTRTLRSRLFQLDPGYCNACVRKRGAVANLPRGMYKTSVNNTFLTHKILAGSEVIDHIAYYQSISKLIPSILRQAQHIHTSIK